MSTVIVPLGSGGDCPSFFPLPPPTPGAGPAANASATPPTHVHMVSGGYMSPGWCTPAARLLIPPPLRLRIAERVPANLQSRRRLGGTRQARQRHSANSS